MIEQQRARVVARWRLVISVFARGGRGYRPCRNNRSDALVRVRALGGGRHNGANDCLYAELLAERDGISVSRVSVRRILRAARIAGPGRRPPSRHRSGRNRMPPRPHSWSSLDLPVGLGAAPGLARELLVVHTDHIDGPVRE